MLCSYLKVSQYTRVSIKENKKKSIRPLLASEEAQTLFLYLKPLRAAFLQRFCRCVREADEASEGISAEGAENTRSFSAVEFRESGEG
jgi:hypothetical protein